MRFWLREFLGWLFMLVGLLLFAGCVLLVVTEQYVQGSIIAFVAFILFRAGVHFLKVAVAARVYMNMREPAADETRSNNRPVTDALQKRGVSQRLGTNASPKRR